MIARATLSDSDSDAERLREMPMSELIRVVD